MEQLSDKSSVRAVRRAIVLILGSLLKFQEWGYGGLFYIDRYR